MDSGGGFGVGLVMLGVVIHVVKNQVARGSIRRNSLVGIRTRATMSSDAAWEAGHAVAASLLTRTCLTAYAVGAITLAIGVALKLGEGESPAVVVVPLCGICLVLALLSAAAVKANAAARAAGNTPS